jgi:hypothetical protein
LIDLVFHATDDVHHKNNRNGEDGTSYNVLNCLGDLREPNFVENDIDRNGQLISELSNLFRVKSPTFEPLRKNIALNAFCFISLIENKFAETLNSPLALELIPVVTREEQNSGESANVVGSAKI